MRKFKLMMAVNKNVSIVTGDNVSSGRDDEDGLLHTSTPFITLEKVIMDNNNGGQQHDSLEFSSIQDHTGDNEAIMDEETTTTSGHFNTGFVQYTSSDCTDVSHSNTADETHSRTTNETHSQTTNETHSQTTNETHSQTTNETHSQTANETHSHTTNETHSNEIQTECTSPTINDKTDTYINDGTSDDSPLGNLMSEVPPPKSDANYLESAPVAKQPVSSESGNVNTRKRRLTKAEQMTLEVLASFNGESFGNVLVKNKSFKEKLIETAAAAGGEDGEPTRKKTRLESAREEIANAFKDIPLGIDVISKRTTTPHNSNDVPVEVGSKRLTRLQKAKMEAIESFGGNDLDEVLGNKKKKQKKEDEKEDENETNETVSSNT